MSGIRYDYTLEANQITKDNFMQILLRDDDSIEYDSYLNFGEVVNAKEFDENKILTETKRNKLIKKYENRVGSYVNYSKYNFYAVNLGVVSFGKFKLKFKKTEQVAAKPKGSRLGNYHVGKMKFKTLSEAKKYAIDRSKLLGLEINIHQAFISNERIVGYRHIAKIELIKMGTMKSKPKNEPKSYIVIPKYLYAVCFVIADD